jgi:hypothetical protein
LSELKRGIRHVLLPSCEYGLPKLAIVLPSPQPNDKRKKEQQSQTARSVPDRRGDSDDRLLQKLSGRLVVGVSPDGRTSERELSGHCQATDSRGPADRSPADRDQPYREAPERCDPYREAGQGDAPQRQAADADGADCHATHGEQPTECDIPNRNPTAGDAAAVLTTFEPTGSEMQERKAQ